VMSSMMTASNYPAERTIQARCMGLITQTPLIRYVLAPWLKEHMRRTEVHRLKEGQQLLDQCARFLHVNTAPCECIDFHHQCTSTRTSSCANDDVEDGVISRARAAWCALCSASRALKVAAKRNWWSCWRA
jgi:hypothetical protein